MATYSGVIVFVRSFAYSTQIRFDPDSFFNSSLSNITGYFSDTLGINIDFTPTFNFTTGIFTGNFIPPHTGIIYFVTNTFSTTITLNYISPRSANLSRTLANCTSVFTAKFYYFSGTLTATLSNVTSSISALFLQFNVTLNLTLANFTTVFPTYFYYYTGSFSSQFINLAANIHGGSVLIGTFNPILLSCTTIITLRTPIWIYVTFTSITRPIVATNWLGKVYPTGHIVTTTANSTISIAGVLPIPIQATLDIHVWNLIPNISVFVVPAGNLSKTLTNCTTNLVLKVPIRIYVTFVSTLVSVSSTLRGWVLIFSTNTWPIKSIVLDWHLKHEMPREGVISSRLTNTALFYAKISNHGQFNRSLSDTTVAISLKTPIRIFVTMDLVVAFTKTLIRLKVAIGGDIVASTLSIIPLIRIRVLIGVAILATTADFTGIFNIKVPIAISGNFVKTLLTVQMYITGRGHYRPVFNALLASLISGFRFQISAVLLSIDIKTFNGPTWKFNYFYDANVGELYPYRSGKYWKLQIFANNGNQSVTTFKKIGLLKLTDSGELIDILDGVAASENFSASNSEYSDSDGMLWTYTLPSDTEIRAYTMEG